MGALFGMSKSFGCYEQGTHKGCPYKPFAQKLVPLANVNLSILAAGTIAPPMKPF